MSLQALLILLYTCFCAQAASKVELPGLDKKTLLDESELVRLAEEEKFSIPLTGRTISHSIEYIPKNEGECQYIEPTISYRSLAQSQVAFNKQDEITAILPLKTRETVFVADPYFNVASFSTDRHFLLKPRLPKTNLYQSAGPQSTPKPGQLVNPVLVATSNEEYIYYLTTNHSFVFHHSNVVSDIQGFQLEGRPTVIYRAIERSGYVLICAGNSGILVYRIQPDRKLKLVEQVQPKSNDDTPIDMELNEQTQLLYVLGYERAIWVYLFDPRPEAKTPKSTLTLYDQIDLSSVTLNHVASSNPNEMIGHTSLQISRNRQDQTLMVLFNHGAKTVIAELSYQSLEKQFSFVRYFKYAIDIREMHVIADVMVVVGEGILGMFPYGVDPRLIAEEFNGYMTLTPIRKIVITDAPFLVAVSKDEVEFGGIFVGSEAGINCRLSGSSSLKEVRFKANLTTCAELYEPRLSSYCQYEKTFLIKQMELTASAPVATSLWVATIVFTLLVVLGLCCLLAIQKKKEREIRRLELYFEEKKRTELPASSQRQS